MRLDNDSSISRGQIDLTITSLIHKVFEDWIEKIENTEEVCIEEYGTKKTISYQELNVRANRLARIILKKMTKGIWISSLRQCWHSQVGKTQCRIWGILLLPLKMFYVKSILVILEIWEKCTFLWIFENDIFLTDFFQIQYSKPPKSSKLSIIN